LKYGFSLFNQLEHKEVFPISGKDVAAKFLRKEIEESVERVVELV
jgi:hypothetical protein